MWLSRVKLNPDLKLASREQLNHLKGEKLLHVIKSLTLCSLSTGCLLHLSLIWLLVPIWGNRTLIGIQSSSCTRSAGTAESTSSLCEEPGRKGSPTALACEQTLPLAAGLLALPPSATTLTPLLAQHDKVHQLYQGCSVEPLSSLLVAEPGYRWQSPSTGDANVFSLQQRKGDNCPARNIMLASSHHSWCLEVGS